MRTPTGYIEESATIINCLCTQCPITNHFLPTPTTFLKGNKRLMGKAITKDLARASSVCVYNVCTFQFNSVAFHRNLLHPKLEPFYLLITHNRFENKSIWKHLGIPPDGTD